MISVLTGDIVSSQTLEASLLEALPSHLAGAAGLAGLSTSLEVFGGDSWQTTCHPPHSALSLAVAMRAYLLGHHGIETRISIGVGGYDSLVTEKISLSQGEAFVLSGRALKDMPDDRRISIQLSEGFHKKDQHLLQAAVALLDGLVAEWTGKQALAVALAHLDLPNYELAQKVSPPISPQAFGKHLAAAKWPLIQDALSSIEHGLRDLLAEVGD
ncbi:hypothetical protein [Pelagicoccus sp. SDUM812003]|uniref:hypothetical protein n=1 Tax=Pelagicoccus sp. SDUM812003 TaxID=3041267 RepID=UPI00280CB561|nr:hypothetical protein [Pelagicoccus sp. SDUM812003]MDQ8202949.1 hypothetical protein [Pelagicoccus sp. SDUM812003]